MENSYNYAALIQMAVTFCFLFVALQKNDVMKRVVDFVNMMLQNIRKEKEQYYSVMSDLMPGYSLNKCPDYLVKGECNLNSVWFLFLLNHNKYNFFFLDLQMLLMVVFGCVQGRRRMSRLYTLAHIRELPFLCV